MVGLEREVSVERVTNSNSMYHASVFQYQLANKI